ncbi:unnamed protein product, partial [Rotaria sp. Silwood1]
LSMMSILRDVAPVRDWLLIIAAADKFELIISFVFAPLTIWPPMPRVNEAPKMVTLPP